MKMTLHSSRHRGLRRELELPADFAQRVLLIARKKLDRRRRRNQIVATAALVILLAAIPLTTMLLSRVSGPLSREAAEVAKPGSYSASSDDVLAYQLAQATSVSSAEDYLLPNAATLDRFTASYSGASWQYDPQLSDNR
jgi:hypothetical protein